MFGVGLGNSHEKYLYLTQSDTDFIFAIIAEELGLVGALVVIALFALFLYAADGARTSRGLAMEHARIPYLALDPDTEAAIRADRAAGRRNPHAFPDEDVARREDKAHDRATLTRPAFARDIEKILNVPRMRTVMSADKVVVLDGGRVAEQGSPAELMAKGGLFARMVGLQTQSAEWAL